MSIETLKQLVAALEYHTAQTRPITQTQEAIAAGKAAIEQTEKQEQIKAITQEAHQKINALEDEIRRKVYGIAPAAPVQEPVAFNAGVPPLYPEMKDGETISVEYTTPPAQPAPVQEPDHGDELTIAYMSGVHRGKELARADEREACAKVCEEFARKWWKIHCDSNLHYSSTLKAHQDFCALQVAIRARRQA